jgi:hypothetical protein
MLLESSSSDSEPKTIQGIRLKLSFKQVELNSSSFRTAKDRYQELERTPEQAIKDRKNGA